MTSQDVRLGFVDVSSRDLRADLLPLPTVANGGTLPGAWHKSAEITRRTVLVFSCQPSFVLVISNFILRHD
jgi:hypothetical protein